MAANASLGLNASVMDGCALNVADVSAATCQPRRAQVSAPADGRQPLTTRSGAHARRRRVSHPGPASIFHVLRSLGLLNIYNNVIIYQTSCQAVSEAPRARLLRVQGRAHPPRPSSSREPFSGRRLAPAVRCPPSLENTSVGSPHAGTGETKAWRR